MQIYQNNQNQKGFDIIIKDFYGRVYHFDIIAEKGRKVVIQLDENFEKNSILKVNERASKETGEVEDTFQDTRFCNFLALLEALKSNENLPESIKNKEVFLLINNSTINLSNETIPQSIADITNVYNEADNNKINEKRFQNKNEKGFEYSLSQGANIYRYEYYTKTEEINIELKSIEPKQKKGYPEKAENIYEIILLQLIEDIRNQNEDLPEELKGKQKIYIKLYNRKFNVLEKEIYQVLSDILNFKELQSDLEKKFANREKAEQDLKTAEHEYYKELLLVNT